MFIISLSSRTKQCSSRNNNPIFGPLHPECPWTGPNHGFQIWIHIEVQSSAERVREKIMAKSRTKNITELIIDIE